ncbi:MAG: non-ribosomal peptide synthetase, partial [Gemmatimonadetes bacterium]|nr:non-ribosomal peptide synthetase [Gemmatimonadota bacterium]
EVLRAYLSARLPAAMVPAVYVALDTVPMTPNGKVDRRALPAPARDAYASATYEAPVGAVEAVVAKIWAEVLKVERVGRQDDFFALGGHSLLATMAVARLRSALQDVSVADLFRRPTPQALAAHINRHTEEEVENTPMLIRGGGTEHPLFVCHGAGYDVFARVLAPHISPDVPVYMLPNEPPGREQFQTIEGVSARLVQMIRAVQPSGPYRLLGYSFAGVLAYEAARQLRGEDQVVEFLGLLDTWSPNFESATHVAGMWDPTDEVRRELERALSRATGAKSEMATELLARVGVDDWRSLLRTAHELGVLSRDILEAEVARRAVLFHAQRLYTIRPLGVPAHLFATAPGIEAGLLERWRALDDAAVTVIPVAGNHATMVRQAHVKELGNAISTAIANAASTRTTPPTSYSPLTRLRHGSRLTAPIFCIPGAGASVTSFTDLAGVLPTAMTVHGLQPRGLDGQDVPHMSASAAAAAYLGPIVEACPREPIHLVGHSFGGWVAFELAIQLRRAGHEVGSCTMIDTDMPHEAGARPREYSSREVFHHFVDVIELGAERSLGVDLASLERVDDGVRLTALHGALVRAGLMPARASVRFLEWSLTVFAACMRSTYTPSERYDGCAHLVLVDDTRCDADTNRRQHAETARAWERWAPALQTTYANGNHVTVLKSPHVAHFAAQLAPYLGY